jgi:ABC-type transport system involved in multi-copper enzyme maturation permease subunit
VTRERILTVAAREWLEIRRNRNVLGAVIALTAVFTAITVGLLATVQHVPVDALAPGRVPPGFARASTPQEAAVLLMSNVVLMFVLIMPAVLPSIMAAHSIVGEKLARSLEPLLATPVRTVELVLGKMLAMVGLGIVPAWGVFAAYAGAAQVLLPPACCRWRWRPAWWPPSSSWPRRSRCWPYPSGCSSRRG